MRLMKCMNSNSHFTLLSTEIGISLTEELSRNYLIEYFDYILEGIVTVSDKERNKQTNKQIK